MRPWLRQLAIDFKYTSKVFLGIVAVLLVAAPIAGLVWFFLWHVPKSEDMVQVQGRLKSYERHEESVEEVTYVELRMLLEGRTQVFATPSADWIFFDYAGFQADVRKGDVVTFTASRKDLEAAGRSIIWIYGLSSGDRVYLSRARSLWRERFWRIVLLVVAIGLFVAEVCLVIVGIRDAARRAWINGLGRGGGER